MIYKSYQIEGNLKIIQQNITLFYGVNMGLKNEFKSIIKKNSTNHEILRFSQDEIIKDRSLIFKEIQNDSLFGQKKIFFIENVNDKIQEIVDEIQSITKEKIYLFADTLEKRSKLRNLMEKSENYAVVPCYEDNEISIKKIIQTKLAGFKELSNHHISLILNSTSLDRVKLNNEIEKIISCFQNKIIDTTKLERLLNILENDDFNKLRDEAFLGNKLKTNKLLSNTSVESEKIIFYLNSINHRLDKLLEVTKIKNVNIDIAINNLKPPIFWKDKPNFTQQTKKWSEKKIKLIFEKTYSIEKKIKSNSFINKDVLLRKLVIDICEVANAS
tara:strand:- start:6646 stop:7632 length:987 start_codon:yes stop_codon:yes gene_type:complete